MKELMSTARNLSLIADEKLLVVPMVEVVLTLTEPIFHLDAGGELVRRRNPETLRFHSNCKALRDLAKILIDFADEAEEFATLVRSAGTEDGSRKDAKTQRET